MYAVMALYLGELVLAFGLLLNLNLAGTHVVQLEVFFARFGDANRLCH